MRIPAGVLFVLGVSLLDHGSLLAQVTPPARAPGQMPFAAAPGRMAGLVQNAEGQVLPAAAITVRSAADSSIVTGVLSDKNGRFRVDGLPFGGYTIRVSLLGYKPRSSEVVTLTNERTAYDFGTIKLDVAPIELSAVEAVAERAAMVVEADRTVYNTKSMPAASGGSAIDLLKAVPELEVDINNNVKMRGNQSVTLQLNGRPMPFRSPEALTNFLQQLPGNRVARLEVIPNPSAKHDPESMGGIVNIVLEENVDLGLSGSLSVNASTRNQQGLGGRLNYQRGPLTLFTGFHGNLYQNEARNYDFRQNLVGDPATTIEQNSNSDNESVGGFGDWTVELKVGKQATLYSNAWFSTSVSDNTGFMQYGIFEEVTRLRDRYDRQSLGEGAYGYLDGGLGFVQTFQPTKHELRIDARLNRGGNDNESRLTREFLMAAGSPANLPIELTLNEYDSNNRNLSIQADYFRPIGQARWDLGYRAAKRDQDYDNRMRVFEDEADLDPSEQTHSAYEYEETFHSIYSTIARSVGKFNAQLGVRAEFAQTHFRSLVTTHDFERDYNTVFPSVSLGFAPRPGRNIRLSYSKSISRPPAGFLNPFTPSTDPLNVSVGNPELRPVYSHSLRLEFSTTGPRGTIRLAPMYRRQVDLYERIRTVDTLGVATNRWENAASAEYMGAGLSLSLPPTRPLNGSVNVTVYRDVRDGSNISTTYRSRGVGWSVGGNLAYKFAPSLNAQLFMSYNPKQFILQGRASGFTYMSLGVRQQLWGTKGSLSLNINDPLGLSKFNSSTRDVTYIQNSRSSFTQRAASLSFTYNFGKPPQQRSRRVTTDEGAGETIRVR